MLDQRRRRWQTLYKFYTNGLCLLGNAYQAISNIPSLLEYCCYHSIDHSVRLTYIHVRSKDDRITSLTISLCFKNN